MKKQLWTHGKIMTRNMPAAQKAYYTYQIVKLYVLLLTQTLFCCIK